MLTSAAKYLITIQAVDSQPRSSDLWPFVSHNMGAHLMEVVAVDSTDLMSDQWPYLRVTNDDDRIHTWGHCPAKDMVDVLPDTHIYLEITDEKDGIDAESIVLKLDDVEVEPSLIAIPDGYGILYQPPQNLATGATIEIEVNASDLASPPNAMDAEVYEFTVMGAMDGKSAGFPPKKAAEDIKEDL